MTAVNTSANTITLAVLAGPYNVGAPVAQGGLTGYGFTMRPTGSVLAAPVSAATRDLAWSRCRI